MAEGRKRLPRGVVPAALLAGLLAGHFIVAGLDNAYFEQVLILMGVNIVLAVSLNLINGFTGQLHLGHAGFMAIGAYVAAGIAVYAGTPLVAFFAETLHLPLLIARAIFFALVLVAGGLTAALAALVVGIPTLHLRGDYLAIATLGFGEIVRIVILNIEAVGGARGFSILSRKYDLRFDSIFLLYAVVLLTIVVIAHLVYSTRGRAYLAVRDDEIAAEAVGLNPTRVKTEAFTVAAFFGGVAGVLFSLSQGYVNPESFNIMRSVEVVVFVVLGGLGSITGSVLAASALTIFTELFRAFADYRLIVYSIVLIAMMILRPQGLLGMRELRLADFRGVWRRVRERLGRGADEEKGAGR